MRRVALADHNFQEQLLAELELMFEPLRIASAEPGTLFAFFEQLGWDLDIVLGINTKAFLEQIDTTVAAVNSIHKWVDTHPQSLADLDEALKTVQSVVQAIEKLPDAFGSAQLASLK